MVTEAIHLHTRDHRVVDGEADLVRRGRGNRLARALVIAGAGILGAAVFVLVPIVHLFTTWLLPLLGLGLAVWVYRIAVVAKEIRGTCPDCGAEMRVKGGVLEDPTWIRCPNCSLPLRLEVGETPQPAQGR